MFAGVEALLCCSLFETTRQQAPDSMSKPIIQSKRQWTRAKKETANVAHLQVSNESVCLPRESDIHFRREICGELERRHILNDIEQEGEFVREGFDRSIRVKKYSLGNSNGVTCPESLRKLALRVLEVSVDKVTHARTESSTPTTHIIVEEHRLSPWSFSGDYAPNQIVTTFDSRVELDGNPDFFVALVPLKNAIIHHINKPKERQEMMWKLESTDHHTNILLDPGSLLVKKGETLERWRSSTTAAPPIDATLNSDGGEDKSQDERSALAVIVKIVRLPASSVLVKEEQREANFGYVTTEEDRIPRSGDLPALQDLLTIVVTTSPIMSHPSTELLQRTFGTFHLAGTAFLTCPKVIVCDGFRKQDEGKVTKKHNNPKQAMRNGIVNDEQASNYVVFKERLRKLCTGVGTDSPFWNTTVEELSERMGYGFALRHALRNCVSTPFVCVIQHDRAFMRPTPMYDVVHAMWRHRNIKYIGINMKSNLMYRDIFLGKYGKASEEEMRTMVLRPPELVLDANKFGPRGENRNGLVDVDERILQNIQAVSAAYQTSAQCLVELEWVKKNPPPEGKHQLTLTPTLFW